MILLALLTLFGCGTGATQDKGRGTTPPEADRQNPVPENKVTFETAWADIAEFYSKEITDLSKMRNNRDKAIETFNKTEGINEQAQMIEKLKAHDQEIELKSQQMFSNSLKLWEALSKTEKYGKTDLLSVKYSTFEEDIIKNVVISSSSPVSIFVDIIDLANHFDLKKHGELVLKILENFKDRGYSLTELSLIINTEYTLNGKLEQEKDENNPDINRAFLNQYFTSNSLKQETNLQFLLEVAKKFYVKDDEYWKVIIRKIDSLISNLFGDANCDHLKAFASILPIETKEPLKTNNEEY